MKVDIETCKCCKYYFALTIVCEASKHRCSKNNERIKCIEECNGYEGVNE